ncbi:hypothetical protein ACFLY3_04355 [Chloroflexota bacterium]
MVKTVKIGEIQTEMIGDINTTDVMNVFLRIGWGAETTSRIAFKPAEDLKTGDEIKVIIEKVYEEPEPEAKEEVPATETSEPSKAEGGEEAAATETSEPSKAEDGEEAAATETSEPSKAEGGEEDTTGKI